MAEPRRTGGSKSSGQREGAVIFALTFLVCVWFFSVPPPIRRTHICPTQFALEKKISGCVAFSDWAKLVTDWYGSCSGASCISWDFSIDPETLKANGYLVEDAPAAAAAAAAAPAVR